MSADSVPPKFQYSPLSGTDAIRLLIVEPGQPDSDVHCRLFHTALSEHHDNIFKHYTALSYVWGDAAQKRTVFVNALAFEVTSNLFDALHDVRHEEEPLRLWADAICIDQSNMEERSSQVGLMRHIYSFAAFTIIYLGKSNDECDEAMAAVAGTEFDNRLYHVVASQILTRPWFRRVWVYQELVLSRVPLVQCGRSRVRWDNLHEVFFNSYGSKQQGGVSEVGWTQIQGSKGARDQWNGKNTTASIPSDTREVARTFSEMHKARDKKKGSPSLLSVLKSRRGCGVSDLRDIIFGHLAVANLPSAMNRPPCPVVDYERSVVDVFTDAAKYIVENGLQNRIRIDLSFVHDILGLAGAAQSSSHALKELPSWVPGWSLPATELPPVLLPPWTVDGRFHDFIPFVACDIRILHGELPEQSVFTARLIKVGELSQVSSIIQETDTNLDPQIQTMLEEARNQFPFVIDDAVDPLALSFLIGKRIAKHENGLSIVPQGALSQDIIYALPLNESHWSCFVLRPSSIGLGTSEVYKKGYLVHEHYDTGNKHFTLVGQALVQLATLVVARNNMYDARQRRLGLLWEMEHVGELVFIH